jgi:hypothetical protein
MVGEGLPNMTTYVGEFNGTQFEIMVNSNTTAKVRFGSLKFSAVFVQVHDGVATAHCALEDGTHIAIVVYSNESVEISVVPKEKDQIISMGFFKKRENVYSWKDAVIPLIIALVVTVGIRKLGLLG